MAETTGIVVPVSMGFGHLTEEEYEEMVVDAMPSLTEVAPTVEIAAEPEKPAEPKRKRACSKCGHADGNSVGKIRRGRLNEKWDEDRQIRVYFIDWLCQPCLDNEAKLPEPERDPRPVLVAGKLFTAAIRRNKAEEDRFAIRTAKQRYVQARADWHAIVAGEQPFHDHPEPKAGRCGFTGCKQELDADAFAVVNGKPYRFCFLHIETLRDELKRQNKAPLFIIFRGPEASIKCQRHLAWLKRRAEDEERIKTPASAVLISQLKGAFSRPDDRPAPVESEESRRAKERQAVYVEALRNGGSLADVVPVAEKVAASDDNGWAAIDTFNRRSEATCAGKRKKGGKKDGGKKDEKKGGKGKRR